MRRLRRKTLFSLTTKETIMHYKTIVLEMLLDRPELRNQLCSKRTLLPTMERYASELKASHEAWKDRLLQRKPGSNPSQIASEALEIALQEIADRLPSATPPNDSEALSLEGAMAFIRAPMPPA
jgi:hypothetical protein